MRKVTDKNAQIWIEMVIYTLIGLAIIGLVLAAAMPRINAKKDEIMIEQSIEAMGNVYDKIYEVQRSVGNRRVVDLEIRKGYLIIDMEEDTISWVIDSRFAYSEENISVPMGRINITTRAGNPWEVELKTKFDVDIKNAGNNFGTKRLSPAPTPYNLVIENDGRDNFTGNIVINIDEFLMTPIDDELSQVEDNCVDEDGDGYGLDCALGTDCNDTNNMTHPGAVEVCGDNIDNDCVGGDLNCTSVPVCVDIDNDGYNQSAVGCGIEDCNDTNNMTHPGAVEVCGDDIDNDCVGGDLDCVVEQDTILDYVNFTSSNIVEIFTDNKSGYSFVSPNIMKTHCLAGAHGPLLGDSAGAESPQFISSTSNDVSASIDRRWSSVQRTKGPRIEAYVPGTETGPNLVPDGTNWVSVQFQPKASGQTYLLVRHMDQEDQIKGYPDEYPGSVFLNFNTWYNIKVVMKLNDINQANGYAQLWINGVLDIDVQDLEFRITNTLVVQEAVHTVYNTFNYTQDTDIYDKNWLVEEIAP